MNKNRKKGFTLVELLVVIAILAILAVVSVVGYTSFTKKAKIADDISLTTQLNTILQANEATDGKNKYPHEAALELVDGGYDVTKITPTAEKYNYVYDLNQNRMFLLDESYNVVSPSDLTLSDDKVSVFGFVGSQAEVTEFNNHGYSVYLKSTYDSSSVTTNAGVDVGNNEDINVSLTSSTTSAQQSLKTNALKPSILRKMSTSSETYYVVRTNGGTLTVNNSNAVVSHFGTSLKVEIIAVTKHSEYGEVSNIEIKSGSVDIVGTAKVNTVVVTGDNVKVDSEVKTIEVKVANTVTSQPTVKVDGDTKNDTTKIRLIKGSDIVTQYSKNLIKDLKDGDNIVLGEDINKQIRFDKNKNISFDLNGHSIKNDYIQGALTGGIALTESSVKIEGDGLIESFADGLSVKNNSTLEINDVKVNSKEFGLWIAESCTVTINSGTYNSKNNALIATSGTIETYENHGKNNITINGGTFNGNIQSSGYIACGIYAANNDTWIVNGGTFNITNGCGILARSGTVNVSKNVVINLFNDGKNEIQGKVGDSKVMVLSGAALVLDNAANYPGGKPTINNSSSYDLYTLENYKN